MATGTIKHPPEGVVPGTITKTFTGTFTMDSSYINTDGHLAILNLNCRYSSGFTSETWVGLYSISPAPKTEIYCTGAFSGQQYTILVTPAGDVSVYSHNTAYQYFVRLAIPYFY